ncbi:alpha/beta fold hydrolase [Arthrobacter sp. NPDC090010]|uniref:alpha/beta fold hydrolase n=1 Tax=Arthrobacter sp. NPDC090010 TaxID=3363942 RepID=UPI0038227215
MDLLLIPGLWLDASSWDAVLPGLVSAGHRPHTVALPGLGVPAPESAGVTITDWVAAVVAKLDEFAGPVVLVGHSGGGNVVWGAAEARPDKVARVIFVDSVPPPPGASINDFDVVDGVIPFPGWEFFDAEEVEDIPAEVKVREAARTLSVPALVPSSPIELSGTARHRVPVTVLSAGMDATELREALRNWGPFAAEAEAIVSLEVVKLGSGHWPQFSMPGRLAGLLAEAAGH